MPKLEKGTKAKITNFILSIRRDSVVRTSVVGWRTFLGYTPPLWLTCDHFVDRSTNQANSAFHPFGETIKRQTWAAGGCLATGSQSRMRMA